jgi:hypothetical protein
MADEPHIKTREITKRVVLKDGTVKIYKSTETYKVKGYVNDDGTVTKFSSEQIAEMKRRYGMGVTIKRIAQDFDASTVTIGKIVK